MNTGLKLLIITATSSLSLAASAGLNGFKPVSVDLGHDKSVYVRQTTEFPVGQEFAFRLLQRVREMGAKNITLEILGQSNSQTNEVFFGPHIARANFDSYQSFVSAAHSAGLSVTFKLGLNISEDGQLSEVGASNISEFSTNYKSFLRYYLKIAQKLTVEEVVIGTGLTKLACANSEFLANLVSFSETFFKGALRVDLASENEVARVACYSKQKDHLIGIGVDLPQNPAAEKAVSLSQKGFLLSHVSFSGEKQAETGVAFLKSIPQGVPMSLGTFLPGPARAINADSPVESKELLTAIENRFKN